MKRLAECDAESVLVRAMVRRLSCELFRSHVRRRSGYDAIDCQGRIDGSSMIARCSGPFGRQGCSGESKIGHAWTPVVANENIFGFEVAMDDSDVVGSDEPPSRLHQDLDDPLEIRLLVCEPLTQVPTPDIFHREEGPSVEYALIVDSDDVWVCEARKCPSFSEHPSSRPGERIGGRGIFVEKFDGNVTLKKVIACEEDLAHSSRSDQAL
jgi:hypothetical protein